MSGLFAKMKSHEHDIDAISSTNPFRGARADIRSLRFAMNHPLVEDIGKRIIKNIMRDSSPNVQVRISASDNTAELDALREEDNPLKGRSVGSEIVMSMDEAEKVLAQLETLVSQQDEHAKKLRANAERLRKVADEMQALDPHEAYSRLMGEVDARNTAKRDSMSPEERRSSLKEETEDHPRGEQFDIRGIDDGGEQESGGIMFSSAASAAAVASAAGLDQPSP